MRGFGLLVGVCLCSVLGACAPTGDESAPEDLVETDDDGKADQAPLAVVAFDDAVGARANVTARKLFKTQTAYRQFFGHDAPADVDFPREWVVFYAAGTQSSGGFAATVERVALSNSGLTLKATTRLKSPGANCLVTRQLTRPYALVKFARPAAPRPVYTAFYRDDVTVDCGCAPVLCDLFCEHGFATDAAGCEICSCNPPPARTVATGQCVRNALDACQTDADCATGGCGGELCFNPAGGERFTTCDCSRPTNVGGCGCVNGQCAWWN